ncbi:MAG: PAS domain S-box protein [Candidatus Bathyarchaeota archaeon]|nr:PAS domain S-box protein [Candidatus Bathyarchaeota archaeon]
MSFSGQETKGSSNGVMDSFHRFISRLDEGFELLELADSGPGGVVDFVFLEVNPAFESLTGFRAANIVGKRKREVDRFGEERWYEYALKALKTGKTLQYEYFNSFIKRYFATQFIPVSNNRIAVLFKDITEHKKGEFALQDSQQRLKIYLESSPTAIFVADPDGKYVFVNEGACRLLQYSKEELLTMNISQVLTPENRDAGFRQFALVSQTGRSRGELNLKRKDGSMVDVIISAAKLPDGNLIANCEDITERKDLEMQLQAKERLAAIGSTAGMVGHDIRNPLQAIIADVFLLKDYLAFMPDLNIKRDVDESLNGIEKNVLYVNKIVADLQDYARPLNPEYSSVLLSDIISSAFKTIDLPSNIKLAINLKDNAQVRTDPAFIQRAITNLANNAIQAMPNGGYLTVSGSKNESSICISVEDTGGGIPDEIKARIFTPMTTSKAKGQGLGLAVVKRLVDALDGTISFESQLGRGTTFTLNLPNQKISGLSLNS